MLYRSLKTVTIKTHLIENNIYSSPKLFDHERHYEVRYYANVAGVHHKIKMCISTLVHIHARNTHEATLAYLSPALW